MIALRGCALLVLLAVCLVWPQAAAGARDVEMTGSVVTGDGAPIPNADVFVWIGHPKEGAPILCPSCYRDCGKRTRTGPDGSFVLEGIDDAVLFRLLAVAEGRQPLITEFFDPSDGPHRIVLQPRGEAPEDPRRIITGQVFGPEGRPLAGATVTPMMFWFAEPIDGVTGSTSLRGSDPLAVTDDRGRFTLYCGAPVKTVTAQVLARGLAGRNANALRPAGHDNRVDLDRGVAVLGRLLDAEGRAVSGARIGLSQTNRMMDHYIEDHEIGTDELGRFTFTGVPANDEVMVVARTGALQNGRGYSTPRTLKTGAPDAIHDVGELRLRPGHTLQGRVVRSDGGPIPHGSRLIFGRADVGDEPLILDLPDDGAFTIRDVAPEPVHLDVRAPGFHVSKKNGSIDLLNGGLQGTVTGDARGLFILLEPGEFQRAHATPQQNPPVGPLRGHEGPLPKGAGFALTERAAQQAALAGEEPAAIRLSVDDADGRGVAGAAITVLSPGAPRTHGRVFETDAGGSVEIEDAPPGLPLTLLVEAEGYLPEVVRGVTATGPGLGHGARLTRAEAGPAEPERRIRGRILGPDGRPLAGAGVEVAMFWFVPGGRAGGASHVDGLPRFTVTDKDGRFACRVGPNIEAVSIVVEARGMAPLTLERLRPGGEASEHRMRPGVSLTGVLLLPDGRPAAEQAIALRRMGNVFSSRDPVGAITDASGRFVFPDLAPETKVALFIPQAAAARGTRPPTEHALGPGDADLGELAMRPALSISGRVVLADGRALDHLPWITLTAQGSGESRHVRPDAAGKFRIEGLSPGTYAISVGAGSEQHPYHLDPSLPGRTGWGALIGRVEEDVSGLTLLMLPGPSPDLGHGGPADRPLRGYVGPLPEGIPRMGDV